MDNFTQENLTNTATVRTRFVTRIIRMNEVTRVTLQFYSNTNRSVPKSPQLSVHLTKFG